MNDELGYDEIAPYAIYPGIHSMPASDVVINQGVWDSLPDDLKQVLEEAAVAFNQDSLEANAALDQSFADARDPETLISLGPRRASRAARGRQGGLGRMGRKERDGEEDL